MRLFSCLLWLVLASLAAAAPPRLGPVSNIPITAETCSLGYKLFFDPRLSRPVNVNGQLVHTHSCATCHDPNHGFTDTNPVAIGINGLRGTRKTPSIINSVYSTLQFWDGRTVGMPTQALQPIVNPIEMGNGSEGEVLQRLRSVGYEPLFRKAYGVQRNNTAITRETYGHAMLSFQSTVISFDTPYERRRRGAIDTFSPEAEIGYGLFAQHCVVCHTPPLLTDLKFHNTGVEFASRTGPPQDIGRLGVNGVNQGSARGAFKTQGLALINERGPYMHNGRFRDIDRVLAHYAGGGAKLQNGLIMRDPNIDPLVARIRLSAFQVACLKKFFDEGLIPLDKPYYPRPTLPGEAGPQVVRRQP